MFKAVVRSLLSSLGYELVRKDSYGRDPWRDLSTLFQENPPKLLFDVGANEGQTATKLAAVFPSATIYSFEPFQSAYERLTKAAVENRRVRPVHAAVGDTAGFNVLHLNAASVTNSLLPNAPEAGMFAPRGWAVPIGAATVPVITIDTFCREHGIHHIDLLKTDTQGYEMEVLRGAEDLMVKGLIAAVFVEMIFVPYYVGQATFQEVYEYLWLHGFRLVDLYNVALNEWKYASWCDALFVHPKMLTAKTGRYGQELLHEHE